MRERGRRWEHNIKIDQKLGVKVWTGFNWFESCNETSCSVGDKCLSEAQGDTV
jgi:hypothetical protein